MCFTLQSAFQQAPRKIGTGGMTAFRVTTN